MYKEENKYEKVFKFGKTFGVSEPKASPILEIKLHQWQTCVSCSKVKKFPSA